MEKEKKVGRFNRLTDEASIAETPSGVLTNHEKPINVKNILSFIAQAVAAFVVVMAYLYTLQYFGI